jgi:hypothetical protein
MASVYDHARPTDDHPAGIYRVVGTGDERVTLLRVADADGTRVHTGELLTVSETEFRAFETAENPDSNRSLGARLASVPETLYWQFRTFGDNLAANPLPAAVALAVLAFGAGGDAVVSLPELAFGAFIIAGSLGLAVVGSGRV